MCSRQGLFCRLKLGETFRQFTTPDLSRLTYDTKSECSMIKVTPFETRSAYYRSISGARMLVFPVASACGVKGVSLCLNAGRASFRVNRILQRKTLSVSANAQGQYTPLCCLLCIESEKFAE